MTRIGHWHSPLGPITFAGTEHALTGLWFDGQTYFADTLPEDATEGDFPLFHDVVRWLEIYFQGRDPGFTPPVALASTPFRLAVWEILKTIPFGHTLTYGDIATRIARQRGLPRMSAQAIGGAVGHNPISLIIPCHRVIGAHGALTGYAGGLEKKTALLRLEGILP